MRCWGRCTDVSVGLTGYLTKPSPSQPKVIAFFTSREKISISNWKEANWIFQMHWSWLSVIGRYWRWLGWSWLVGLACQWTVSSEQKKQKKQSGLKHCLQKSSSVHCSVQCGTVALDTSVLATLIHLTWKRRVPTNNSVIDRLITGPSLDIT